VEYITILEYALMLRLVEKSLDVLICTEGGGEAGESIKTLREAIEALQKENDKVMNRISMLLLRADQGESTQEKISVSMAKQQRVLAEIRAKEIRLARLREQYGIPP
jgi:hypothetical protein